MADRTVRFARSTGIDLIAGLTPVELRVATALASWDTDGDGIVCPGLRAVAELLDRSPSTIRDVIRDLITLGVVEPLGAHPRYRSTHYRLVWLSTDRADALRVDRADGPRVTRGWSARYRADGPRERGRLEDVKDGPADADYVAAGLAGLAAARAALDGSPRARWRARTDPTARKPAATIAPAPRTDPRPLPQGGASEVVA